MTDVMPQVLGILVVGHGTKSAQGMAEFDSVVAGLREHFPGVPMAAASLEFARPNIGDGIEHLANQGVTTILTVPLLLFSAGHAKNDIPNEVQHAAQRWGVHIAGQADVLGCHPQLIQLSLARFLENCETHMVMPAFVLIGRGSTDPEAQCAVEAFVADCKEAGRLSLASYAFLSMARPTMMEHLEEIGRLGVRQVVLIPHLLFHGELIEKCQKIVLQIAEKYPQTRWSLARHLGPHASVVQAATDRIQAALTSSFPKK